MKLLPMLITPNISAKCGNCSPKLAANQTSNYTFLFLFFSFMVKLSLLSLNWA